MIIQWLRNVSYVSVLSVLRHGTNVTKDNLLPLPTGYTAAELGNIVQTEWKKEVKLKGLNNASIYTALWRGFGRQFLSLAPNNLIRIVFLLIQTQVLSLFLSEIGDDSVSNGRLYLLGSVLVSLSLCTIVYHHWFFHTTFIESIRWRSALISTAINTALHRDINTLARISTGHIMNMVTNDAVRLLKFSAHSMFVLLAPCEMAVCAVLLWRQLGAASLVGWAALFAFVGIISYSTHLFSAYRNSSVTATDERIQMTTHIVQGLSVIKMNAWEAPFLQKLAGARNVEMKILKMIAWLRAVGQSLTVVMPILVAASANITAWLINQPLTAANVFVSLVLFQFLQNEVAYFLPMALEGIVEFRVAVRRLKGLLQQPEMGDTAKVGPMDVGSDNAIVMCNASLDWTSGGDTSAAAPTSRNELLLAPSQASNDISIEMFRPALLRSVNMTVRKGQFCAVFGKMGAGKSTLLLSLLGELPPQQGWSKMQGTVSYAPQEPWIFNGTVRSNILFGTAFDDTRYRLAIDAACLVEDVARFPEGDQTLLGDNGVMVSGGQRARIGLARALYAGSDVLLLDDPLAAVDAKTSMAIVQGLKASPLVKGRSILLMTHHTHVRCHVDRCYQIAEHSVHELAATEHVIHEDAGEEQATDTNLQADGAVFTASEDAHSGRIPFRLYKEYILSAFGWTGLLIGLAAFCCHATANTVTQAWLAKWIEHYSNNNSGAADAYAQQYAILAVVVMFASLFAAVCCFLGLAVAGAKLHSKAAQRVISAPMSWINVNPAGRILNRFSRDIGALDDSLPFTFYEFIQSAFGLSATLILVCVINPYLLIACAALTAIFIKMRTYYLDASRVVKRLESASRSPLLSLLAECLSGAPVVRAFGKQAYFMELFHKELDHSARCAYNVVSVSRWLGFWMDFLCVWLFAAAVIACIPLRNSLSAEYVGLVLSQVMALVNNFQWCVRQSAETENEMICAERVLEYANVIPCEDLDLSDKKEPTTVWPSVGDIVFEGVHMRYRPDLPEILHRLSFHVPAGSRVGIVGRSGSGKSSIFAALLRLAPPSSDGTNSGVRIDGVDTNSVSLTGLRRALSIIPQQPLLFAGTLRFNLDPLSEYSDEECWRALASVHLDEWARLRGGLSFLLSEGGTEASCGQRQCLCLARAILRHSKVILCDEATANVDHVTDQYIQEAIKTAFKGATVVIIAHRLQTVMDTDLIVVVSEGRAVQVGSPSELATQPGLFAELIAANGLAELPSPGPSALTSGLA